MDYDTTIQDMLIEHINDEDNPHQTTKEDLNLGQLKNYPVASPEEALGGEVGNRYLTPARLKDVFDGHLMRIGLMDTRRNVIFPT